MMSWVYCASFPAHCWLWVSWQYFLYWSHPTKVKAKYNVISNRGTYNKIPYSYKETKLFFFSKYSLFLDDVQMQLHLLRQCRQVKNFYDKDNSTNHIKDLYCNIWQIFISQTSFKVLSNTDHMTLINFSNFAIVFTLWYCPTSSLCREDLRNAIMISWNMQCFPAKLGLHSTKCAVFTLFYYEF